MTTEAELAEPAASAASAPSAPSAPDMEFRIQEEREQFALYEQRRGEYEAQATATTAGALTMAALLVAGQDKLAQLGAAVRIGTGIAMPTARIRGRGSWL
jgi:hypothetical protein